MKTNPLIVGEAPAELFHLTVLLTAIQDFHSLTWLPPVSEIQEIKHEHELETYSLAVLDDHLPEKFPAFHCFPTFEAQKDEVLIISNIDGLSSQLRDRFCNKQLNSWFLWKTPIFRKALFRMIYVTLCTKHSSEFPIAILNHQTLDVVGGLTLIEPSNIGKSSACNLTFIFFRGVGSTTNQYIASMAHLQMMFSVK